MNKGEDINNRMFLHNAVMRWKCSLLSESERRELEEWIENDAQDRWDEMRHPWKATQTPGVDEMTAENRFIQEYVLLAFSSAFGTKNHCFSVRSTPSHLRCKQLWTRSRG